MEPINIYVDTKGIGEFGCHMLDKIEKVVGFIYDPHDKKKYRKEALASWVGDIKTDSKLSSLERAALIYNSRKILKKYMNMYNIVELGLKYLDEKSNAIKEVDDDWISMFFSYGENISDKDVQEIWGKILAYQFTNGNETISKKLLFMLSIINKITAKQFESICQFVFPVKYATGETHKEIFIYDGFLEKFEGTDLDKIYKDRNITLSTLVELNSEGLIHYEFGLNTLSSDNAIVNIYNNKIEISKGFGLGIARLTREGEMLFEILNLVLNKDEEICNYMKQKLSVES